jgi:hypothetical protein
MMWPPRAGAERSLSGKKRAQSAPGRCHRLRENRAGLDTLAYRLPHRALSTEQKNPGRMARGREVEATNFLVFRSDS